MSNISESTLKTSNGGFRNKRFFQRELRRIDKRIFIYEIVVLIGALAGWISHFWLSGPWWATTLTTFGLSLATGFVIARFLTHWIEWKVKNAQSEHH